VVRPEQDTWQVLLAQALLDHGANIDAEDEHGSTALHYAIRKGDRSTTQFLLDRGAQIESRNHSAMTLLLDHGLKVDSEDEDGFTSLQHAVRGGYTRVIRGLLDRWAQVDARDNRGRTPLHLAAGSLRSNMYPIVLLLDYGADINARDDEGLTPLNHADRVTNGGNARLLRHRGAIEDRCN
jgi:ankyrin repeat protein